MTPVDEHNSKIETQGSSELPTDSLPSATESSSSSQSEEEAEWSASMDTGEGVRLLNQEEIDSLLGVTGRPEGESNGLNAVINSSVVSYERLPMLEVVFDRMVRLMTTSLRNFTSDNVDVSLEFITAVRFGDYLDSIPLPAMLSVFKIQEWDNTGLVVVESSLIYSIVDVLLGGRRGAAQMKVEDRAYTTIERNLVERLIQVILTDLTHAFEPLSKATFKFERLETNPRFATIVRPSNAAVNVRLKVEMEDRGGFLNLVIPYGTLEPVRELLLQMFLGEKFGRDSIWESHLIKELLEADIQIDALLDQITLPLSEIGLWQPGSQMFLNATPNDKIKLCCGEKHMFTGRVGRKHGKVAIQIEESLITDFKGASE